MTRTSGTREGGGGRTDSLRLNRYLARCGLGSRRAVEDLVRAGRVAVRGEQVVDLGRRVEPGEAVTLDGLPVNPPVECTYVLLNKPAGYLCSRKDPWGRPLIYDLLPAHLHGLHYVGRLDRESRGLLLLTDDGDLTNRLLHPRHDIEKLYRVRLDIPLDEAGIKALHKGVAIGPGETARASRIAGAGAELEIGLREGKKREVRRMLEALGRKVVDLQRIEIAGLRLGRLPEGKYRTLGASETALLHAATSG